MHRRHPSLCLLLVLAATAAALGARAQEPEPAAPPAPASPPALDAPPPPSSAPPLEPIPVAPGAAADVPPPPASYGGPAAAAGAGYVVVAPYGAAPVAAAGYDPRRIEYDLRAKSAPLAFVLELFLLPGIGLAYDEAYLDIVWTWVGVGGGAALLFGSLDETTGRVLSDRSGQFYAGLSLIVAGRIYGLVMSIVRANEYNDALATRLGLGRAIGLGPTSDGSGLALTWHARF